MKTDKRRTSRPHGRRHGSSEKGQAALAIILGVVLVMVTVPLVADLLVTGQQVVVNTAQNSQQAAQAAQAGLVDFENHVAADAYYASPTYGQGYCSANGPSTNSASFLNGETIPAGGTHYSGCDSTMAIPAGQTDANDPGFSNSFDGSCQTSKSTASSSAANTSFGWDLYSGSQVAGEENSEYQFIVDSRAVSTANINAGDATAYVYVTGRSGISGHYICRSIKAAVNVLDPTTTTATATSAWGSPTINTPTPPPNTTQTITFSLKGGSGAAGGNGFFIKGGTGGLGGTVTGTFTAPSDFLSAPTTPIYFGTWAGNGGALGASKAAGYDPGGAGGKDGGGGGASSVFCVMKVGFSPGSLTPEVCNASMPICSSPINASTGAGLDQDPSTGCIIAIAAGGGGGGEAVLIFLNPGIGGKGGISPTNGTNATGENNGGGAATAGAGGTGGNGTLFGFIPTANGVAGSGPAATATSGGAGATYAIGGDGGGGGGGYYGGGGGGAGFVIIGGGGGGGGINWSATGMTVTNGTAPAGTKNGSANMSVTTESSNAVTTTYTTGCTGTNPTATQTATPPAVSNATWNSVGVFLAGGGGGGGAVPPEKSTQPYSEPGGVGGYIGATNGTANGAVTLNINGSTGSPTPPSLTYEIGCGGAGGTAGEGSSTVASGDNAKALSALAGTLDVASSTSFVAPGQVSVVASGGTAVLSYTGTGSGTLTGVAVVSGTTTWTLATGNAVNGGSSIASGDNGTALSALAGTLYVAASTSFTPTGQVTVATSGGAATLAYTGLGTGTLTGVTIVSGTGTWTLATGNAVTQPTVLGSGGGGYGTGGGGGIGTNTSTAGNGGRAASGGGGGASELCLGSASGGCGGSTPTCANSPSTNCVLAIAGGGGGGAEGTSDGKSTAPPGPGGPGWGGLTNGSCTAGTFEPGGAWTNYNDTWYWPGTNTVASGDNSKALSVLGGTLDVASSTSFTATGQVYVVASGGTATLAYTGTGTGTLTGVTVVSGTTSWTLATGNAVTQVAEPANVGPPGNGTQGTTTGTGVNDNNGNGSAGSQAPCTGGAAGGGGSQTVAGNGGSSAGGCTGSSAGSAAAGGASESASCESGGGGGAGGYYGGGAGGGGTGGGFGGGGGSSYLYNYANGSGTGGTSTSIGATQESLTYTGTPFVPPIETAATYVGSGAAGAGATTTSTTAGANGGAGQPGVLILQWHYVALGQPEVTDSCTPGTGVFAQGSGTNPLFTYFPELGPTTFAISGGAGGSSLAGVVTSPGTAVTAPGGSDVDYVTVNVQPGELFSYVEGCSGYLSLGGPGFAEGGSSGPTTSVQTASWGGTTNNIGGSDYGGEAGGGGGASALCSGGSATLGALCSPSAEGLCTTSWTTSTDCVLAIAGGGGGAGAATWNNTTTTACTAPNLTGGIGGVGPTILTPTYSSGNLTPGQLGWDPETTGPGASTVTVGDNGVAFSALGGTLDIAPSASFTPTGGEVSVATSSGTAILAYTGTATGTLTGVTMVAGSPTGSSSWTVGTGNAVSQVSADGDWGGDTAPSGTYSTTTPYSMTSAQGASSSPLTATIVSLVTLFGTAGGGGGFEGGEAGQSLSQCSGGGGSSWWLSVASGQINSVTGQITNPLTGLVTTSNDAGSVTIQGFNNGVTAERSNSLGATSW